MKRVNRVFFRHSRREKNRQVLRFNERLVVSNQAFDELSFACMEDSKPSKELLEAARKTDELGIHYVQALKRFVPLDKARLFIPMKQIVNL